MTVEIGRAGAVARGRRGGRARRAGGVPGARAGVAWRRLAPWSNGPSRPATTIYGVTTGFGSLADVRIDPSQAAELQHGIVRSHATAVGAPLSREEARAMLLLRAHVLALGHSGVRAESIDLHGRMLNADVIPAVPQQGRSARRATSRRSRTSRCR